MSYVAIHHTEIAGCLYTPGEVISKPISAEKAERLIRLGAIEPLMKMVPASEDQEDGNPLNAASENDADDEENDEAEELSELENDEDIETPVVDVMDGIVAPEPVAETAAKPKTSSRRKRA